MIRFIRTYLAKRRLERITQERRDSFETEQYRRRRAAALKGRAIAHQRKESMGV
jgi:hypothetical protein